MLKKHNFYALLAILAVAISLSGCLGATPTAATAPTQDLTAVESTTEAIQTQAASTVIADLTLNAPAATNTPEATATTEPTTTQAVTNTPEATATPVVLPTATRAVVVVATNTPGALVTNTPSITNTPSNYQCAITDQSPANGYKVAKGSDFDADWTIKNTGTQNWNTNDIDVVYVQGTKMHENGDVRDLPSDVATGNTFRLVLDMTAPNDVGRYTETWGLTKSGSTICTFSVTVDVTE